MPVVADFEFERTPDGKWVIVRMGCGGPVVQYPIELFRLIVNWCNNSAQAPATTNKPISNRVGCICSHCGQPIVRITYKIERRGNPHEELAFCSMPCVEEYAKNTFDGECPVREYFTASGHEKEPRTHLIEIDRPRHMHGVSERRGNGGA